MSSRAHNLQRLEDGMPLAVEVDASLASRRRWIGVYPLGRTYEGTLEARRSGDIPRLYKGDRELLAVITLLKRHGLNLRDQEQRIFCIRRFEVARAIPADYWLCENDLLDAQKVFAFGATDLEERLAAWGVTVSDLKRHDETDYPI